MNVSGGYSYIQRRTSGTLFHWRNEATLAEKLMAAMLFALLTALAAQVRFYLPFSPVPFTGQVLVVLVASVLIGRFGAVSQGMYIIMGASFGWFTAGGFSALMGVTGGYLIGFVVASLVLGEMVERKNEWNFGSLSIMMLIAVGIIHLFGVVQLALVLHLDLYQAILIGSIPFIIVDGLKVGIAVGLSRIMLPSKVC